MGALTDARGALADAVSATGLMCTAHAPDTLAPPAAFVDTVTVDYDNGGVSFTGRGLATATIVACAQRNDRAGATQNLEDLVPDVLAALTAIDGVRLLAVDSGRTEIAGKSLPAVAYTVQFGITG